MKNRTKIWLVAATSLSVIGLLIFGGMMMALKWDFSKLLSDKYETNEYEINEDFSNISVCTDSAQLHIVLSDDGRCRVKCFEQIKAKHTVSVEDDTLVICVENEKKWHDYLSLDFFSLPKITVYLPEAAYKDLVIDGKTGDVTLSKGLEFRSVDVSLSTGDITLLSSVEGRVRLKATTGKIVANGVSVGSLTASVSTGGMKFAKVACAGAVDLRVSTGDIKISDMACQSFASSGSTGEMNLKSVVAEGKMSIERSTGDVYFTDADAGEIMIETDTGDIRGSFRSDKVIFAQSDTGRVDVPRSIVGGKCEITTDTGDIKVNITGKDWDR